LFDLIESLALSNSSLQSTVIPLNSFSINASPFRGLNFSTRLFELGDLRFVFDNAFLIDSVDHKVNCSISTSSHVKIPSNIEILGSSYSGWCETENKSEEKTSGMRTDKSVVGEEY
jgi:hypothetical protein